MREVPHSEALKLKIIFTKQLWIRLKNDARRY